MIPEPMMEHIRDDRQTAEAYDLLSRMLDAEEAHLVIKRRAADCVRVTWFRPDGPPHRIDGYGATLRDAVVDAVEQVETPAACGMCGG